ncbi:MAG: hypothetical protein WCE44_13330 [Candidatus Velthaea sp.]
MPQFLVIAERNLRDFPESAFAPLLEPEAEAVRRGYAAGIVRRAWGRKDKPGAIVLIEVESPAAAEAYVASLPLRQAGMLDAQIVELSPYRGFGPRAS